MIDIVPLFGCTRELLYSACCCYVQSFMGIDVDKRMHYWND